MQIDQKTIDSLEHELATLTVDVEHATHRQLTILRTLEPTQFWGNQYARSFAHWLSWRIGLAPGAAREKIRVARALGALPSIDAAYEKGLLSYSKVRALTRVATKENEAVLLDMALHATAAHLEKICRGVRRVSQPHEPATDAEARWVRQRAGTHGMVRIDAQLHADEAAIVWKALERARGKVSDGVPFTDALVRVASAYDSPPERRDAEVVVHVREEIVSDAPGATAAVLDDGTRVPAETLRRVACDCSTRAVVVDGNGMPIDVGRKRRTVTPELRRALEVRDGTCRFPGCHHQAWLDAHHVEHWLHGGETNASNLVLLCPWHHRLVHEGGFTIVPTLDEGRWMFLDPFGHEVKARGVRIAGDRTRIARAETKGSELVPKWDGHRPDISWCVEIATQKTERRQDVHRPPTPSPYVGATARPSRIAARD